MDTVKQTLELIDHWKYALRISGTEELKAFIEEQERIIEIACKELFI